MNSMLLLDGIVRLCGWALVTTLLLLCAWSITRAFRKNAALRHLTWLTAFCVVPLLPGITAFVPSQVVIQAPMPQELKMSHNSPRVEPVSPEIGGGDPGVMSASGDLMPSADSEKAAVDASIPIAVSRDATFLPETSPNAQDLAKTSKPVGFDWIPMLIGLLVLWLMGVGTVLVQGAVAVYGLTRMRRQSVKSAFDSHELQRLSARLGLTRGWELRISRTSRPLLAMTWGFVRPVVLLPVDAASWPKERLEAVMLHELAHVRRADSLSQLLAFLVCALFWFNPVVWRCARAMREDAETAADNTVLLSGIKPSAYATELLQFAARIGHHSHSFSSIGVYIMKPCQFETRIKSIVASTHSRRGATTMDVLKACISALIIAVLLVSLRPSVSFAEKAQDPQNPALATPATTPVARLLAKPEVHATEVTLPRTVVTRHIEPRRTGPYRLKVDPVVPQPHVMPSALQSDRKDHRVVINPAVVVNPDVKFALLAKPEIRVEIQKQMVVVPNFKFKPILFHIDDEREVKDDDPAQEDAKKAQADAQEQAKRAQAEAQKELEQARKEIEQAKKEQQQALEEARKELEKARQEIEQAKREQKQALEQARKEIDQAKKERIKAMEQAKKEMAKAKLDQKRVKEEVIKKERERVKKEKGPMIKKERGPEKKEPGGNDENKNNNKNNNNEEGPDKKGPCSDKL